MEFQHLVSDVELPGGKVFRGRLIQAQVIYDNAATQLNTIPFSITREQLEAITSSRQLLTRLWAIECLLQNSDLTHLGSIKKILLNPPHELLYTVDTIARSIERLDSADIVPIASELLRSTDVNVRLAATMALGNVASQAVIKPLATVALKDDEEDVRYHAIFGLGQATGNFAYVPTIDAYKKDEARYLNFWLSWASSNVK